MIRNDLNDAMSFEDGRTYIKLYAEGEKHARFRLSASACGC